MNGRNPRGVNDLEDADKDITAVPGKHAVRLAFADPAFPECFFKSDLCPGKRRE